MEKAIEMFLSAGACVGPFPLWSWCSGAVYGARYVDAVRPRHRGGRTALGLFNRDVCSV